MSVIIYSGVTLDILTKDKICYGWAAEKLAEYAAENDLVINQLIYAEISIRFSKVEELDEVLKVANIKCENIPFEAGFLAGKYFMAYKNRGGDKGSVLPDFI